MPRLLTYNVHQCLGIDGILSPARIAAVIRESGADIVALQELDVGRLRSGLIDQAEVIARDLEMDFHFHPAISMVDEAFGDAILTTLPLRLVKADSLPAVLPPFRHEPRGALWVEIAIGSLKLQLVNTHLGVMKRERRPQIEELLGPEWLGHPDCRDPVIVAGDLNALPRGRTYRRLAERFTDVWRSSGIGSIAATYPTRLPMIRIDHVFHGTGVTVEHVHTLRSPLARLASDHLPLVVDFTLAADSRKASVSRAAA